MPFVAHSADLKARAVLNVDEGVPPKLVKALFGVSERSLRRWRFNQRKHGSVNLPPSASRGRPYILASSQFRRLLKHLRKEPDMSMPEMVDWCAHKFGRSPCPSALYNRLRKMGWSRKRLRRVAAQQDPLRCEAFEDQQQRELPAPMCIWIDESSKDDRTIYRHYGWAPRGHRAVKRVSLSRGKRYSILPAMTLDGYIATRIVSGSVSTEEFIDFVLNDVLPLTNPWPGERSILVMDNCAIHKNRLFRRAIRDSGRRLVFIPPYAPKYNPIEESFSCYKSYLRKIYRRLQYSVTPELDLLEATGIVTPDKCRAWATHAGYPME